MKLIFDWLILLSFLLINTGSNYNRYRHKHKFHSLRYSSHHHSPNRKIENVQVYKSNPSPASNNNDNNDNIPSKSPAKKRIVEIVPVTRSVGYKNTIPLKPPSKKRIVEIVPVTRSVGFNNTFSSIKPNRKIEVVPVYKSNTNITTPVTKVDKKRIVEHVEVTRSKDIVTPLANKGN